jgi:hypothetical protein
MGLGGGIIKRKMAGAMLFALAIAVCIVPLSEGLTNQNIDKNAINSEIKNQQVSNANSVVTAAPIAQVNAAKKYKKTYKKTYKKNKKTYKKYKKTYKSKKVWSSKYHKYITVKAAYTYRTTIKYTTSIGKVTSTTVTATAKCSCGALGNYNLHTATFQNYCPRCHKSGVLKWNPKGTAEGEWTCNCGADYCAACGKEKIKNNPTHLTKA